MQGESKMATLGTIINSQQTGSQIRNGAVPFPRIDGYYHNSANGESSKYSSRIPAAVVIPLFYPEGGIYDHAATRAEIFNGGRGPYAIGKRPVMQLPATIPRYRYHYERRDSVAVTESADVAALLTSSELAAYAKGKQALTVKPHIVNVMHGHGVQIFNNYANYETDRQKPGHKTSLNTQPLYETLLTYAAVSSHIKHFSEEECHPWEIGGSRIRHGPNQVSVLNPIIVVGPNNNSGYALTSLISEFTVDFGLVFSRGPGLGVYAPRATGLTVPMSADIDYLFNQRNEAQAALAQPDGYIPCFSGDPSLDPTFTFTGQWGNGTRKGTVVMLPAWLFYGSQEEKDVRVALFISMFQPPICTAISTVEFETVAGNRLEGLMYHAAGTHRTVNPTNIVFVMPMQGTDNSQTVAGRSISMPCYGPRAVWTCRPMDTLPASTLVPAGTRLAFGLRGDDINVSGSAFIGSWVFKEAEINAFIDLVQEFFKCDGDMAAAFDALSEHCVVFARTATIDAADITTRTDNQLWDDMMQSYNRDVVVTLNDNTQNMMVIDGYWQRMRADGRSVSSWINPETMVKPVADLRMIAAVLVGFYDVETKQDVDTIIYKDLLRGTVAKSALMCQLQTLKLVISDATFEAMSLPPALLMGTTSRRFCRLDKTFAGDAVEAERMELQKQFKATAAQLFSRVERNIFVTGVFAMEHAKMRELYAAIPSVQMFAEYYKLSPEPVPSTMRRYADGTLLFYQCSPIGGWDAIQNAYQNTRPFDRMSDYGVLTGYSPIRPYGAEVLPLISTGMLSGSVHRYYGREIPKLDLWAGGSPLPWCDLLRTLSVSKTGRLGVVIAPTISNAAGKGHNDPGDYRMGDSTERFVTEQMMNVLSELGVDSYQICTYNDRFIVMGDNSDSGRPAIDHATRLLPSPRGSVDPPISPNNAFARLSMYARRPPAIDSTLAWLYFCIDLDDARNLRGLLEQHVRRAIGFQYENSLSYVNSTTNDALDVQWFNPAEKPKDIGGPRAANSSKDIDSIIKQVEPPPMPPVVVDTKSSNDAETDADTKEST